MMMFPLSRYNHFLSHYRPLHREQRYGQAFYDYMELHKITSVQDKEFCDKLYQASNEKAYYMIQSRIDDNC